MSLKEAALIGILVWVLWPTHKAIGITPPPTIKLPSKLATLPQTSKQPEPEVQAVVSGRVSYTPSIAGCTTYWSGDYYLDKIINFESGPHNGGQGGGNSCATNPGDCFGLLQACPGAPLRAACGGDPTCQIKWFIDNKTGGRSWAQVWQHELDWGWW